MCRKIGITVLLQQALFVLKVCLGVVDEFVERLLLEYLASFVVNRGLQAINQTQQLLVLRID